jgi:UDPglucose--hexose-1-phosphate uridylyltransferase
MKQGLLEATPHRRFNPLTWEWVLVSPHRTQRPWQGQIERSSPPKAVTYDPRCYLCPGNERAGGARNPNYTTTFVFTNDFAALKPDAPSASVDESGRGLLVAESEVGTCKVVCFSPRHDLTLPRMSVEDITRVVDVWAQQYAELGAQSFIHHVAIFENRGEMMGCSNPHPHCQIWANQTIPNEPRKEQDSQRAYAEQQRSCLLCDYLQLEIKLGRRLVCENEHFAALVPFWAIWPFEILLIAKEHTRDLLSLSNAGRSGLAEILKRVTTRYDNLFEISFPYSMGFHQAPTDGEPHPEWHLHAHYYPPLLRSATVRKFMVGYEMLATPQRDITPEVAAERLRQLSETHYMERAES